MPQESHSDLFLWKVFRVSTMKNELLLGTMDERPRESGGQERLAE